jgi:CubicO group peptidase (beta-lactamase class C family)
MKAGARTVILSIVAALAAACSPPAPPAVAPAPAPCPTAPPPPAAPAIDPSGDWEIRWDRTYAGWWPAIFEGKLSLQHNGETWSGQLSFRQSGAKPVFESLRLDGEHVDIVFRSPAERDPDGKLELSGWFHDGRLIGEIRWGTTVGWTPVAGRRYGRMAARSMEHALPAIDVAASGLDARALDVLLEHADEERSTAVVIVKDGKIAVERYRESYGDAPIVAMSASKSIVSLAIGMLVADGKLTLDTTMASLFPEWRGQGPKGKITVRQLLTHTSGLDPARASWDKESIRERALAAKLVYPPGTRFQYNNGAVDFLGVVFKQAAGVSLDAYLETRLFRKLDFVGAHWMKDKEGTPRGAGELLIRPVDLAKIGQLMLDGGTWKGERILPAAWVDQSVAPGQPFEETCGFLWWREGSFAPALTEPVIAFWRDLGIDAAALKSLKPLIGKKYDGSPAYASAVENALGAPMYRKLQAAIREGDHLPFNATLSNGPVRGFSARGSFGQYLVVLPKARLVAVRMYVPDSRGQDGDRSERNSYPGFREDVARLVP